MLGPLTTLKWFLHIRHLQKKLVTPDDIRAWQAGQLRQYLARDLPRVGAYKAMKPQDISELPLINKDAVLENFEAYNRDKIPLGLVRKAADENTNLGRLHAGASTGTSGNRGYFLITNAERYRWLGVILAKTLPDILSKRRRVALALPSYTKLYDSAAKIGRINISFFDLSQGIDALIPKLAKFDPTTIVAPPRVLRALAESATALAPQELFSAAEVLDPQDRHIIETRFGLTLREIYMATEGLLGVSCAHGTMHLAEDALYFEYLKPYGEDGLATLVHTDFTRSFQLMPRYQMNDLVQLAPTPCPCGSPLQAVTHIHGRADDVFKFKAKSGAQIMVTPDIMRNAVVKTDSNITDFRIYQTGAKAVELVLPALIGKQTTQAAAKNLALALETLGATPHITLAQSELGFEPEGKLRRVICKSHD